MKRAFLTFSLAALLAGCDSQLEPAPQPAVEATPRPVVKPKAEATPKPGEWRMKDYKNPLDKKH